MLPQMGGMNVAITFTPLTSIPIRRCSVSLNCHLAAIIQ